MVGQDGWDGVYNITEQRSPDMDYTGSLLTEGMARCAEQARTAESNVSTLKMEVGELKAQIVAMMMGGAALYQQPPLQAACLSPQLPPISVPH